MKSLKRKKYFYVTQYSVGIGLLLFLSQIEMGKVAKLGVILFVSGILMLLLDIRGLLLFPDDAKADLVEESED